MHFPTPQGMSSQTFKPPPLDGSMTLVEVFDHNAKHSPDHPLFKYYDDGIRTVTWREATSAFHVAAQKVRGYVKSATIDAEHPVVVAILAIPDSIPYFSLIAGIMRAGFVPFPISVRNSDVAVAHLLKATSAKYLFVSQDPGMQKLAASACVQIEPERVPAGGIEILPMLSFNDLYGSSNRDVEFLPPLQSINLESPAVILHSSGSTSFPKPITLTYRLMLEIGITPSYGEVDVCDRVMSAHAVPMFHMQGVLFMPWNGYNGMAIAVFPPSDSPTVPNAERVLAGAIATKCEFMISVPALLETWIKDSSATLELQRFDNIVFGGGPLDESVGDLLIKNNVNLTMGYGLTETGLITTTLCKAAPKEGWNYFTIAPNMDPALIPIEGEENLFRLVMKKCPTHSCALYNTTVDGVAAYDTSDIVARHPTNPNLYRIYGRYDDQIMHSTGEKTNPAPIEAILLKDERITSAVMFGRSKFHAGVLVAPSAEHTFDPTDLQHLAEYRNLIWDTVEKANRFAPQHSRIFKEMIVVAHPDKPFEYTVKGTPRRQVTLKTYDSEIEAAYRAVEESSQSGLTVPKSWDLPSVLDFVRKIVRKALDADIGDSDHLFRVGADSLSATSIRNTILMALRQSGLVPNAGIRALPQDLVFKFPSINGLSTFVFGFTLASQVYTNSASSIEKDADMTNDPEGEFVWPKLNQVGQTIVKLRKGKGEPPLILIPGAGGTIRGYGPLQSQFRSALWALQVTPDTPVTSLEDMAAFYFRKIKEEQPSGPYRLSSYSGSSIVLVELAHLFERNGDTVIQMAFIDHFPTTFFLGSFDYDSVDLTQPSVREEFLRTFVETLCRMQRADGDGKNPLLHRHADELWSEYQGTFTNEWGHINWGNLRAFVDIILDFATRHLLAADLARGTSDLGTRRERAIASLILWTQRVKAPATIYIAKNGVRASLPEERRQEWADLGVRRSYPDARVIYTDNGHYDILSSNEVFQSLQEGYL